MKGQKWVLHGLWFGGIMFLATAFLLPYVEGSEIDTARLWYKFIVSVILGGVYAFSMKKRQERLDREKED